MFTTYIKSLNDMVFTTVSFQVICTPACLCYAERRMAILNKKSMDKQSLLIFTFDHIPALPVFVHRQFVVFVLRVTKLAYVNLLCACLLTAAAHVSTHLSEFFLCFTLV